MADATATVATDHQKIGTGWYVLGLFALAFWGAVAGILGVVIGAGVIYGLIRLSKRGGAATVIAIVIAILFTVLGLFGAIVAKNGQSGPDPRQAIWDADIAAWSENNREFMSEPTRVDAMDRAIKSVERKLGVDAQNSDIIREAQALAFTETEWDPESKLVNPYRKFAAKPNPFDQFDPKPATPTPAPPKTTMPPYFVDRGWFGGCPTGYVDHPADPKKCALPYAAARILRR